MLIKTIKWLFTGDKLVLQHLFNGHKFSDEASIMQKRKCIHVYPHSWIIKLSLSIWDSEYTYLNV